MQRPIFLALATLLSLVTSGWPAGSIESTLSNAVSQTFSEVAGSKLKSNELAVALVDLNDLEHPAAADYRGDVPIYPASVIKLFYLAAAHEWMERGKLEDAPELRRALRDMIVESSNDATHYVVDLLTGTTAGPELPEAEMKIWSEKRNAVNRYFQSVGYTNCNMNQKPWGDGPYGRERLFVGKNFANRNALTVNATARLLAQIARGKEVSVERSKQMLELLKRDPSKARPADDCEPDQALDFTAPALPRGVRLWSKAGWTSATRHDAAYIELPNGARFVLVTFTTGHANDRNIIPALARRVIEGWPQ